jgi:uracil-DNA glycosylase family 4
MNYVPGIGPSDAKIAIVGEAPGAEEERQGKPFVGPTGKIVDQLLLDCGIDRREVYVTNVVKVRPPGNNIRLLGELGKSLDDFLPQLFSELDSIKPNVVIGFGNTALTALTGNRGIEKWRGSILQTVQGHKFIPTIHPASLLHAEADGKMRSWKDLVFIRWDIERAVRESRSRDVRYPLRDLKVAKSSLDVFRFFDNHSSSKKVAVDIETYKTIPLCIAFAFDSYEAISIPLFDIPGPREAIKLGKSEQAHIWKAVSEVLYDPKIQKIGQNFKFDQGQLEHCINGTFPTRLDVRGFYFDTMLAFKVLYPELPAGLQFISSVYTDEPYYKDEGKEYNPAKDDPKRLLLYNAKDAVITYECYKREVEELAERDLSEFFFTRQMPLHNLYYDIERRGIRRDDEARLRLRRKYEERLEELSDLRFTMIGKEVNVNSPKQVDQLLYKDMKLPQRKGTGEIVLDALLRNTIKSKDKQRVIENILEERKVRKTLGTYVNCKAHPDGRLRTGYRLALETGRTSTSVLKPPVTTESMGVAFQTITKHSSVGEDLREMFIPSEGCIFIEPDLSQAEARVVAILARDERLQKFFEFGVDIHRVTASWIRNDSPDADLESFYGAEKERAKALAGVINEILKSRVSEEDRQLGKKFRHAGHYDMGKGMAALQAEISEARADIILTKFHQTNPNIKQVFHKEIQEALKDNNRILTNPFGRQRIFMNRWGQELFKEAYANIPQGTVSDHLKFTMLRLSERVPELRILQESHDSFLAECKIGQEDRLIPIIKEELEQPIDFTKCTLSRGTLIIPCEIKIGAKNWREMKRIV